MSFSTSKIRRLGISTTGFLVVLICWGFLARGLNPLILPSPGETIDALGELAYSGKMFSNIIITLRRALLGYGLAIAVGLSLAILLNAGDIIRLIFRPLVTSIQTIPPVVWLVLAVIWFGIAEDITPVFLIFIVTFPVIFINISEGLKSIDLDLIEMARVYRCTRKQVIFEIYLPALIPHLVSAISIGLAFAWKSTIFAEFFGSSSGIGFALSMANSNLETEELFAWALILVILMLIFEYLLIKPLQRYVTRWREHG